MAEEIRQARLVLAITTVSASFVVMTLILLSGMRVDYPSLMQLLGLNGILLLTSAYCSWRGMFSVSRLLEAMALGLLLTMLVAISTYVAALPALPMADAYLAGLDQAVGFDWRGFVREIDALPGLAHALWLAYQSFPIQLLMLPLLLAGLKQVARAYQFVTAYALIGLSASLISVWFPALGAFRYYEVSQSDLVNINTHFGYFFLEQFEAVRSDPQFVFSMQRLAGIVTFPSVHAAVAALCAWATWSVSYLRYPLLVVNVGMAVSAVSHGGHYLVDVPAGVLLAAASISLSIKFGSRSLPINELVIEGRGKSA